MQKAVDSASELFHLFLSEEFLLFLFLHGCIAAVGSAMQLQRLDPLA